MIGLCGPRAQARNSGLRRNNGKDTRSYRKVTHSRDKYYHGENNEKGPNMFLPQQSIRQKSPFANDKEVKGPQSTYISRCMQIMIV